MADLDKQLSLSIKANADDASKSIDGLISRLRTLNQNLNLGNLNNFSRQLRQISSAASSLNGDNLKSFSGSLSKIAKVSDIDNLAESLRGLEDITIPDFSGLSTLADGVSRLSRINPNKIADIVNALHGIGKASTDVGGIKGTLNTLDGVLSELSKEGNKANFIVDDLGRIQQLNIDAPIKQVVEELREAGNAADYVVDSSGNIARISNDAANSVDGVAQSYELAVRNVQELQAAIAPIGEEAQEAFSDLQLPSNLISGDVIDEYVNDWTSAGERLRSVWQSIQEDLDGVVDVDMKVLDWENILPIEPLDKFDLHLRNVLLDLKTYSGIMSNMKSTPANFNADEYKEAALKVHNAREEWEEFEREVTRHVKFGSVDTSNLSDISLKLTSLIEKKKEYDRIISRMESGEIVANASQLEVAYRGSSKAAQEIEQIEAALGKASKKTQETKQGSIDLIASLVALSHEVTKVASAFDKWGDAGIKALKVAFKPLAGLIEEFKTKTQGIQDAFGNMRKNIEKNLTKLSAFWRRVMKTFTFMVVRKAITAILDETKNAVDSLASWSNTFGTAFNTSMSEITANVSFLARSIIGALEPVINAIVPMLNALSNAIANALRWLGEFFAALTGQNYFMVAKKQVGNYADSLNKANKAQKNLTMGIDELNILSENESGGGKNGAMGGLGDWDTAPVSDKMKKLVDEIKELLAKIFDPLKKAWDIAGKYVLNGFKYMTSEIGKLLKAIGKDFLEVWNQPETLDMLVNILKIIGDIEYTIGTLAKKFREAWESGDKGLHILENIRDIFAIIIQHVRNVTLYMSQWSTGIDFNPLLAAVETLTDKLKVVAEFVGGVFEDVMKNVVLKYIEYMIEDGIPHLLDTISEIIDAFDFEKLREQLVPLEEAFEGVLENIHEGITNAIGNVGKAVGEFTQSQAFQDFLDTIVWFMEQITAERVEKLFTGLGTAILDVAESLMKFVSSDTFKDFIQMLLDWYDSKSPEDIAKILENIAKAILLFKFTGFVGKGVSGFASFLSVAASAKNAIGILSGLGTAGTAAGTGAAAAGAGGTAAAGGLGAFAAAAAPVAAVIAGIVIAVKSFVDSFGGLEGAAKRIKDLVDELGGVFSRLAEKIGLSEKIEQVKTAFDNFNKSLGEMKNFWEVVLRIIEGVAGVLGGVLVVAFDVLLDVIKGILEFGKGLIDMLAGIGDIIVGIFTGDMELAEQGALKAFKGIIEAVVGLWDTFVHPIGEMIKDVIDFFKNLKYVLIGDPIVYDIVNGVIGGFKKMVETVVNAVKGFVDDIKRKFVELASKVITEIAVFVHDMKERWEELKNSVTEKVEALKSAVKQKISELVLKVKAEIGLLKQDIIQRWEEIKNSVTEKVEALKTAVKQKISELVLKVKAEIGLLKQDLLEKWGKIKEEAEIKWNEIKGKILEPVEKAYKDCVEWFTKLKNDAGAAWDEFVDKIKDSKLGKFFEDLAGNVKDLIDGFIKIKDDPLQAWNDFCSAIENSTIVSFISGLVDKVKDLINGFKNLKDSADSAKDSADSVKAPQAESHFNGGFVGTYATGGYPSRGTLFWAGEYGLPEMLGTVGGKTAVASSAEITGIRESVMESSIAEQNMMGQMINLLQAIAAKDLSVNMDSRELLSSLNDRARRNGYNFRAATT